MAPYVIAKYFSSWLSYKPCQFFCIHTPLLHRLCSPAWTRTLHPLSLSLWKPALPSGRSDIHKSLKLKVCTVTHTCWLEFGLLYWAPVVFLFKKTKIMTEEHGVTASLCLKMTFYTKLKERIWDQSICPRVRILGRINFKKVNITSFLYTLYYFKSTLWVNIICFCNWMVWIYSWFMFFFTNWSSTWKELQSCVEAN